MTEQDFIRALHLALHPDSTAGEREEALESLGSLEIKTFGEVGLLTDDEGLVVRSGGREFLITITDNGTVR